MTSLIVDHHPQDFPFEWIGTFLQWVGKKKHPKGLILEIAGHPYTIQLKKKLRNSLTIPLEQGSSIKITGISQFNPKKGQLKLKAESLFLLSPPSKPIPKISICSKPNCWKKGGQTLYETLQHYPNQIIIEKTGCLKQCKKAPCLQIANNKTYGEVNACHIPALLDYLETEVQLTDERISQESVKSCNNYRN